MFNICRLLIFAFILLLAGCSSTTLNASWKNPEYSQHIETVYIVGVAKQDIHRRLFEPWD